MNLLWIGIAAGSIGALIMRALINEFVSLMRDISTLRETLFSVDDFELDEFKDPEGRDLTVKPLRLVDLSQDD